MRVMAIHFDFVHHLNRAICIPGALRSVGLQLSDLQTCTWAGKGLQVAATALPEGTIGGGGSDLAQQVC